MEDVSLMSFLVQGIRHCLLVMSLGLCSNRSIVLFLLVCLLPFSFLFQFLLKKDILLTILVDVLHEIDTSLVFAAPLSLFVFPLLSILMSHKSLNVLFVSSLIFSLLAVMGL